MRVLDGAIEAIDHDRVLLKGLTFCFLHILFQITECLIHLKVSRCLIEATVHGLIELFLLHLRHLLNIGELKPKKTYKRESHDYCYDPNRTFLHINGKGKAFLKYKALLC